MSKHLVWVLLAALFLIGGAAPASAAESDPLVLFDEQTGEWHVRSPDGSIARFHFGAPGDYAIWGDWDCDGTETAGVYREATDTVFLRNRNSTGWPALAFQLGIPGQPIAGDWNGDGCDTIGVFRNGEISYVNWLPPHNGTLRIAEIYWFGRPGDWPITGDFNGDGTDTVAVHRPETGRIYVRNSLTTGTATFDFIYTRAGDRVLFGDWDGDGRDTVAGFRPQDTTFRLNNANTAGPPDEEITFGDLDWLVPGAAAHQPFIFNLNPGAEVQDLGLDDQGLPLVAVSLGDEGLLYSCLDMHCSTTSSASTYSLDTSPPYAWGWSVIRYPTLVVFETHVSGKWQIARTSAWRFDISDPGFPSTELGYPGNAATDGIVFDGDHYVLAGVGNARLPYCNPGNPHEPCHGDEPLPGLRVHRCDDQDCTEGVVLDEEAEGGGSLELDAAGNPVMTYWREGLRLSRCSDPTCGAATLSESIALDPDIDHLTSLLIGPDGNPLFAYYEETGHDLKLAHCHTADCSSITRVVVDRYGWVGRYPSLAIGPDGNPVIAYQQIGNKDLRLAHCHDLDCTSRTITTIDAVGHVGFNIHLAVDPRGNAIIAYEDLGQFGTYDPPLVKVATIPLR